MHTRREFIYVTALAGCARALAQSLPRLDSAATIGSIRPEHGECPIEGATWYVAEAEGAGFIHRFPAGSLLKANCIVTNMLLDGDALAVFLLALQEGEQGRSFQYAFGGLNQCSFRVHMALDLVNQNRFFLSREGGLLKPMCLGDRVDLDKVDRMTLTLHRKAPGPVRWCMTPLYPSPTEVEKLGQPILPKGALLDEFGQSTLREWPAKTRSLEELKTRIQIQYESASTHAWPDTFTPWGGWKAKRLAEGKGFFRTHNDGRRWWLVDPDGYAFWSVGVDCVRIDCDARYDGIETALKWMPDPEGNFRSIYSQGQGEEGMSINYLAGNLIRVFGPNDYQDKWMRIVYAELKRLRFNTIGNWSDLRYPSKAKFPYVLPMEFHPVRTPMIYRDFPDVFLPDFEREAAVYADGLKDTVADPALIGYFLMNEPAWGSSREFPATGMLYNTKTCATRTEMARFLKSRYSHDAALAGAWKMPASFDKIASGQWTGVFTPEALRDIEEFSVGMVERYFRVLSEACRKVDPHHLNLGMRWAGVPPVWAVEGMKLFDVFSLNRYDNTLQIEQAKKIHDMIKKPVLIGEFHFGALDVGLPASGIGHLKNQGERAKAYRVYMEDAAADVYCVGTHWFTLYDESALGRDDGENYNIGFLDICNRPYKELGEAAVASHERMYEVADGRKKPFHETLDYLPKLFL